MDAKVSNCDTKQVLQEQESFLLKVLYKWPTPGNETRL